MFLIFFFFFFLLMENLGAMVYSRYTGFREITDRDVLELHCTHCTKNLSRALFLLLFNKVCICNVCFLTM